MNADGAAGAPRAACVALGLGLAALTLPFDARWLDFEATRRALACLLGAIGFTALVAWRKLPPIRGGWMLLLLCTWALARTIGTINTGEARLRVLWWFTLACAVPIGAVFSRRQLALASLPTGLAVAAYGIAQALALDWPAGYGGEREAVSTLGNRNVAAECELLAFACAAWWIATAERFRLAGFALLAFGMALGANGSRAALVAVPVVVGLAWLRARPHARRARSLWLWCSLFAVVAGGFERGRPVIERGPFNVSTAATAPSTVEVRLALWKGVLGMIAEAPLLGHGSGQLRFAYPQYRTQGEIEASSFGRQFPTLVDSAHNDPLEVAAELGLVGTLLCAAFLVTVLRGARLLDLLPLLAFGVVALARAPTGNAPAALVAALWLGTLATRSEKPARHGGARVAVILWMPLALAYSSGPVLASFDVASWLRSGDATRLDTAIERHGSEPRYRSLRIRARCGGIEDDGTPVRRGRAEFAACREDLDALARLDPYNTESLLLIAQLAHGAGERELARAMVVRILTLDRREPRAQLLAAVLLFDEGKHPQAIATLYADPHPRLRERLSETLLGLRDAPAIVTDARARALYERECAFVYAVDEMTASPASEDARAAAEEFGRLAGADDPRVRVVLARALLAAGKPDAADRLAPPRLELGRAEQALLAPLLDALRVRPAWAASETR